MFHFIDDGKYWNFFLIKQSTQRKKQKQINKSWWVWRSCSWFLLSFRSNELDKDFFLSLFWSNWDMVEIPRGLNNHKNPSVKASTSWKSFWSTREISINSNISVIRYVWLTCPKTIHKFDLNIFCATQTQIKSLRFSERRIYVN